MEYSTYRTPHIHIACWIYLRWHVCMADLTFLFLYWCDNMMLTPHLIKMAGTWKSLIVLICIVCQLSVIYSLSTGKHDLRFHHNSHIISGNCYYKIIEMFHKVLLELTNWWMLSTLAVGGGTSGCMCGGCEC